MIRDVAKSVGVGLGNLESKISGALLDGWGSVFTQGTVASGSAVKELTGLLRGAGMSWSIQDGTMQVLGVDSALEGTAVLVSSSTGMLGSPSIDHKGIVNVKMLLIPDVFPGRKLRIESEELQGFYRVIRAKYSGDSAGDDWMIEVDCTDGKQRTAPEGLSALPSSEAE